MRKTTVQPGRLVACILLWAATLGWLYLIFFFSGQNGTESGNLSMRVAEFISRNIFQGSLSAKALHPYLRKLAHFGIFAVQGFLLMLSLSVTMRRKIVPVYCSGLTCVALAALNELHQSTVDGRVASMGDVGIDSAGAACGILAAWLLLMIIRCIVRRKKQKFSS